MGTVPPMEAHRRYDTMTDQVSDSLSDSGLSLTDAAAQLGISERTVIRRIKDSTIIGKKIGEGRGGVWRVYLDGQSDRPAAAVSDSQRAPPEVLRLLELLEDERRERAALVQRNEQLAGQLGFVQAKLQDAEEQIRLLSAPKDEAPIGQTEATPAARNVPEPAPRRSLWARVVRRLAGSHD